MKYSNCIMYILCCKQLVIQKVQSRSSRFTSIINILHYSMLFSILYFFDFDVQKCTKIGLLLAYYCLLTETVSNKILP